MSLNRVETSLSGKRVHGNKSLTIKNRGMRFPTVSGKNNTSCLSKVPSKRGSGKSGSYYGNIYGDDTSTTSTTNAESWPEVGYLSKNVIYIKTDNGQYATLNISDNTSNEKILSWGKRFGVDMSPYLN